MALTVAVSVTVDGIAVKLGRLIAYYLIRPHVVGWRLHRDDDGPIVDHFLRLPAPNGWDA
jgi:hypothetical protein